MKKILFIGCGNMGEAFLKNFLESRFFSPENITGLVRSVERKEKLTKQYKISVETNFENLSADLASFDFIFLAIKPQNLEDLSNINFSGKTVISILAGTKIQKIAKKFEGARVVRAMPNLGQFVNLGMSGIYFAPEKFSNSDKTEILSFFKAGGAVLEVLDEVKIDAITAISGSGPAYFFRFCEALSLSAQNLGFSHEEADLLVRQTLAGASSILQDHPEDTFDQWRKKVTSRGGTTEAGLKIVENSDFEKIIETMVEAAFRRAGELG